MFVFVDIEGTGGKKSEILEFAAICTDKKLKVLERRSFLIKPKGGINFYAQKVHGISLQMVKDCEYIEYHASAIKSVIDDKIMVAHSTMDFQVISSYVDIHPARVVDTLKLSKKLLPESKSYSLSKLIDEYQLTVNDDGVPHRAGYDAAACMSLFEHLVASKNSLLNDIFGIE